MCCIQSRVLSNTMNSIRSRVSDRVKGRVTDSRTRINVLVRVLSSLEKTPQLIPVSILRSALESIRGIQ
jgi:hypothetical protein